MKSSTTTMPRGENRRLSTRALPYIMIQGELSTNNKMVG
jgi:hypothetical protein